jgi:hypothetical protein
MDVLAPGEVSELMKRSRLAGRYNAEVDSNSAHEMLREKINRAKEVAVKEAEARVEKKREKEEPSFVEQVLDNSVVKSSLRTAATMLTRTLLGTLFGGKKR